MLLSCFPLKTLDLINFSKAGSFMNILPFLSVSDRVFLSHFNSKFFFVTVLLYPEEMTMKWDHYFISSSISQFLLFPGVQQSLLSISISGSWNHPQDSFPFFQLFQQLDQIRNSLLIRPKVSSASNTPGLITVSTFSSTHSFLVSVPVVSFGSSP